jgi:hypothetical protein
MMSKLEDKYGNKVIEALSDQYKKEMCYIATHLRSQNFDGAFAIIGESPHLGVLESWNNSLRKWIVFKGEEPVAIFGVRPAGMFSDIGIPWLSVTDGIAKIKRFFVAHSKPMIKEMRRDFEMLVTLVDARFIKAIRYLKWCGFKMGNTEPFGALGLTFHKFYMECEA